MKKTISPLLEKILDRQYLFKILRFGLSGLAATLTHALIFLVLIEQNVHPLISNTAAFLLAFCVSFILQSKWTFQTKQVNNKHFAKFLFSALLGFLLNSAIVFMAMQIFLFNQYIALAAMVIITTPVIFLVNNYWVFPDE